MVLVLSLKISPFFTVLWLALNWLDGGTKILLDGGSESMVGF